MKLEIKNYKVDASLNEDIKKLVLKKFRLKENDLLDLIITKKSVDARNKKQIFLVYSLIIEVPDYHKARLLQYKEINEYLDKTPKLIYPIYKGKRPIIIGFGPAGIFCALFLARSLARPIIIERGSDINKRNKELEEFLKNKVLNENSNVQFGEGGAGTFSDGKLTTNINDPLNKFILTELVKHGAPKEILYESMPHIGTDFLGETIKNIRKEIVDLGGDVYFSSVFTDLKCDGDLKEVHIDISGKTEIFKTDTLVLGVGHSARDTIKMLYNRGIRMEGKAFSMGVRIEHSQKYINKLQHGNYHECLPPATYKLAVKTGDRSVYTFCMSPGGTVMASQNKPNTILTNGMSNRKRDGKNANSALLVNVEVNDYYKTSVLDGLDYQEKYEKLAFMISGDYKAPINLLKEFCENKVAERLRSVIPSYPHGHVFADLSRCLPKYVYESLKKAIPLFDRKMKGFAHNDAVLTAVETRSSCPIRMLRDENRQSSIKGVYPIGEGAGYAGGIMSAAIDGIKTAMIITGGKLNED